MANISLSTVVSFRPNQKPEAIELKNVDMGSRTAPPEGVTFYYGFKEASDEQADVINKAVAKGEYYSGVTINVDVLEAYVTPTTPETLPNTRLLSMNNISKAMEYDIIRVWKQILAEEGIDVAESEEPSYWKNKQYVLKNPQLVGKLRNFEQFAHLEVIAYPFDNPKIHSFCKRATLFSYDHVTNIRVEAFPEVEAKLPELGVKRDRRMTA